MNRIKLTTPNGNIDTPLLTSWGLQDRLADDGLFQELMVGKEVTRRYIINILLSK